MVTTSNRSECQLEQGLITLQGEFNGIADWHRLGSFCGQVQRHLQEQPQGDWCIKICVCSFDSFFYFNLVKLLSLFDQTAAAMQRQVVIEWTLCSQNHFIEAILDDLVHDYACLQERIQHRFDSGCKRSHFF